MSEEWRAIPGTDGLYSVSSEGNVRSEPVASVTGRPRGRVLSPRQNRKGYLVFRVCLRNGVKWQTTVHQAVAATFIGPRPSGFQVDHKDGDKANNRVENLEYVSCKENIRRAWAIGLNTADHCRGEKNHKAKLTAEDVMAIRAIYPAKSMRELAADYGVTASLVSMVVNRKTWKHVPC